MRKKFSIIVALAGILLSSILSALVNTPNVFAASAIDDKYLAKDLLRCYNERLKTEIIPDQVYETEDLLLDEWTVYNWGGDPLDEREPLGALHTTEGGDDELGCIELLDQLGFSASSANVGDVLLKLGYEPQTADGKCITLNFQRYDGDNYRYIDYAGKPKLCASSVDSNGVIQGELMGYEAQANEDFTEFGTAFWIDGDEVHLNIGMYDFLYESTYSCGVLWLGTCYNYITYEIGVTKWDDLVSSINTHMYERMDDCGNNLAGMWFYYNGYNSVAGDAGAVSSYKLTDPTTAFMNVGYKNAFGSDYDYDTKLKVTSKEQAVLYQNYLSQYYAVKSDACKDTKEESTQAAANLDTNMWVQTKVYGADGKPKYCYVTATKHQYEGVYGITGNTTSIVSDGRIYWQDIAAWLLDNGPNSIDAGAVSGDIIDGSGTYTTPTGGSGDGEDDQEESEEAKCYQNAKSLGWVICPVIYGLRDMTEHFYEAVEPLLETNESIVGQLGSNDSGLYKSWLMFRNVANIIFVILFMFIIFSQLTGWGIDNYGIKKMLPKLILTAIIVNLSYIICSIAVDASNIVGHGVKGMLEQMGAATGAGIGDTSVSAFGTFSQKAVGFIAVAGTTAVAAGVAFALEGWALIIPVLLFLLTIVISIFFALVILGVRQALVVILIVVSPVAFACSLLPNTEPIFKKWFSASKGILMVYPIVGAVIGAGYLTASILMSSDQGFIMTLVSGILMVVPYFMIPSLTRKALDAVGGLGTKIGNVGHRAKEGSKRTINNTDAVRNAKADSTAQRAQARAAKYMNSNRARKVEEDIKAGKKVSMRRANKYQRAAGLANADRQSVINARSAQSQYNRLQSDSGFGAAMSAANMAEDATTTKNYETMLAAGDYKYLDEATGETISVDSQSNKAIAAALQHEMSLSEEKGYDANKVRALTNALAAKGKEGRDLMYHAVSGAQKAGASRQAIKDFSSNIMNNHAGTMKEKARSLYEFAKNTSDLNPNVSGDVASIESFAGAGVASLTAADMTNMDIQQLERYRDGVVGDKKKTETLAGLAQSALTDEHLSKDLSDKTRSELEKIARQGGYTPPANNMSGDSGKIHTATSTQTTQASTAQADAQQIAATQTAQQLQDAVKNSASVPTNVIVDRNGNPMNGNAGGAPKSVILGPDGKPLGKA